MTVKLTSYVFSVQSSLDQGKNIDFFFLTTQKSWCISESLLAGKCMKDLCKEQKGEKKLFTSDSGYLTTLLHFFP